MMNKLQGFTMTTICVKDLYEIVVIIIFQIFIPN